MSTSSPLDASERKQKGKVRNEITANAEIYILCTAEVSCFRVPKISEITEGGKKSAEKR